MNLLIRYFIIFSLGVLVFCIFIAKEEVQLDISPSTFHLMLKDIDLDVKDINDCAQK